MNNEYVIINKTAIQKIIEKLNKEIIGSISNEQKMLLTHELDILKIIISNSTPLIPVVKKAFDAGHRICKGGFMYIPSKRDYIANLKLDI